MHLYHSVLYLATTESTLQGSRLQTPDSSLQTPDSGPKTADFRETVDLQQFDSSNQSSKCIMDISALAEARSSMDNDRNGLIDSSQAAEETFVTPLSNGRPPPSSEDNKFQSAISAWRSKSRTNEAPSQADR